MKNTVCMMAALAATAGWAAAADFQAQYTGVDGYLRIHVDGFTDSQIRAGYANFEYAPGSPRPGAGQFNDASFKTFCIDVQPHASGAMHDWDISDIADAPVPGSAYGGAREAGVHAVIAAAMRLNWIASDLTGANGVQATAIQGAIWAALADAGGDASIAAMTSNNAFVDAAYAELINEYLLNTTARVVGLKAMVSADSQDMLYIVPLPPAAWAGIATLAGVAGVSRLRRR